MRHHKTFVLCLVAAAGVTHAMNDATPVAPAVIASTGAVRIVATAGACSGTLIAPTWVLSGEHCAPATVTTFGGGQVELSPGLDPNGDPADAVGRDAMWDAVGGRWIVAGFRSKEAHETMFPGQLQHRRALIGAITVAGAADATFGTNGWMTPRFPTATRSEATVVLRDASGDFVIAGMARVAGKDYMMVASFDPTGALDRAPWNATGRARPGFEPAPEGIATAAALAADNGLVIAGHAVAGGARVWRAARFLPDGTPDPTFAPYFGTTTPGELLDVIRVGGNLAWLGRQVVGVVDQQEVILYTVALTTSLGARIGTEYSFGGGFVPARLVARGTDAVWIAGTDTAVTRARAIALAVPTGPGAAFGPAAGWPDGGAVAHELEGRVTDTLAIVDAAVDGGNRLVIAARWTQAGTPIAVVARFAANGAPDLGFGQSGVLLASDDHDRTVFALALNAAAPNPPPLLLVGSSIELIQTRLWATLVDTNTTRLTGGTVDYGGPPVAIAQVVRHPVPGRDVALFQLAAPITSGAMTPITGAVTTEPGDSVLCLGYGRHETGTGQLRQGMFQVTPREGRDVVLSSTSKIRSGDSGGGCFEDGAGGWRLAGVIRAAKGDKPAKTFGYKAFLVEPADFVPWVEATASVDSQPLIRTIA